MTMKDLGIDRLTTEQKIALAHEIWESLDATGPPSRLTDAQRAELHRRDAEMDANPERAMTWAQIRANAEAAK